MARPITWQDVAAPQLGASLAAAQAAGDSITNSLRSLGNTTQDYAAGLKEDATKQAVAAVMASEDPMAAAAAQPQGWKIDPMAVQAAANATDARLRGNKASDASLAASKTSTELNQAQLDDRTASRQAATMASPMIDQIMKTGKLPSIDLNTGDWKSQAGNLAYKEVLDFWGSYTDDKRAAEDMYWRRQQTKKSEAEANAVGWAREFGASAEGQAMDPALVDRAITAEFKRRGVGHIVGQGAQYFEQGAAANRATYDELDQDVPNLGNATYGDVKANLGVRAKDLENQKNAAISEYDRAIRGQELAAGNVFKGPVDAVPADLAARLEWDEEDATEAIDAIRAEYPGITEWQAADIALATKGKWFEKGAARSDLAKARAGQYADFNKIEGAGGGLAKKIQEVGSPFDRQIAGLAVLQRQTDGAARAGKPLPNEAINITKGYQSAAAAKKEAEEIERKKLEAAEAEDAANATKALQERADALQRAIDRK